MQGLVRSVFNFPRGSNIFWSFMMKKMDRRKYVALALWLRWDLSKSSAMYREIERLCELTWWWDELASLPSVFFSFCTPVLAKEKALASLEVVELS